ncbi:rod shape-determining protein RodA [Geitlerinema sp. PCC 9228]|jgi:rod shape determining protein RodA|uniref:rod shape-determining protein RodA n=1 Tax=Geitlerinema sp. PCC 9228 TaxID=111611 RepID=UPI0008F9CA51|nr:rod shape-determining protein RodA [Geitlerinema sp. PCC 9228]
MWQSSLRRIRWSNILTPWQNIDWLLIALPTSLMLFGGLIIKSTQGENPQVQWWQHWFVGVIGVAISLALGRWRYDALIRWRWAIYGITNILLVAVIFLGTTALGAQRWLTIGGLNVQPSEFAKLGAIVTLAASLHERSASQMREVFKILAIAAVPWVLVFLQPDLGTSLVFGAITLGMLYWGNAHPGWLILLVSPAISAIVFGIYFPAWLVWTVVVTILAASSLPWKRFGALSILIANVVAGKLGQVLWGLLKDYQKDRILSFLDPSEDPLGSGYHLIQSRIAIGAGQLWGRGWQEGTQTQLDFIPEQHTDFIFSAIGEELGFVGCIGVLLAFWLICLRLVLVAQNAKDNFGSLLAIGVLSMLFFQVMVNIGMTIGLAPVTGIPLPWISYGRSAMVTNFIAIGLVESVANHRQRWRF